MFFRTIIFLCLFSLFSGLYAAEDDGINLKSSAEKYNDRGFTTASSQRIDGNVSIGDYDGNLSVVYSLPIDLPNGLSGDLSLIYNSNVEHRVYVPLSGSDGYGYMVNSPEWIIGFKGIALQTLNFNVNFAAIPHQTGDYPFMGLTGEQVPMLIPGYHYTNFFNTGPYDLSGFQKFRTIFRY
jgi:hypothetical protein